MEEIINLSLNEVEVVSNTRSEFNENGLKELALSIKTNGVIQPITVKPQENGKYRLICGERRYRASLLAGKSDIPARVTDIPDHKILQFQIVENLQRRNVSTMDEVRAIVRLRVEEGMTEDEISKAIGKAKSHVAAQFRISRAAPEVHDALERNLIYRQVGLIISALDTPEKQVTAVNALRRDKVAYLVKAKEAENWINNHFGVAPKKLPKGSFAPKNNGGGRFASDWKYYLLRFSPEQFEKFKEIVRSRTDIQIWIEAVEEVMLENNSHVKIGGGDENSEIEAPAHVEPAV